jgi:CBS domain containing-hemolysin-like protein
MELSPLAGVLVVLALIFANGFFVAAEFALVSARSTRIDQLADSGNAAAKLVQRAQADPNRFISAAQLGITVASLLLGWLGEETFAHILEEPLSALLPNGIVGITMHGIASVLAIVLITFLHISLGEQVPKMLALQKAETVVMISAPPTEIIGRIFRPFIALLYGFTNLVLRLMGLEFHAEERSVHSPDELLLLVNSSAKAGLLSQGERELVERAFAFSDLTAAEVMVPRTEIIALDASAKMETAIRTALRHRHSRFPVYEGDMDNVVGVVSAKDLLAVSARRSPRAPLPEFELRRLMRPPIIVTTGAEVSEVLARMKAARQPLAVVLDEFGGTAGIVTLKDLVSRLLGEMGDEYAPASHEIRQLVDGSIVADGLALVEDVNSQLGSRLDTTEVDTLGGLVFARIGRRPVLGDEVDIGSGYRARVERLDGLRIARVRLVPQISAGTTEAA